ncbi:hypothetical protein MRBBS_3781 [Marinobacter sp. BSs20148]|nr:hypothetical protein MRBBS_3781 [Marinobacter sp. BSs20148]
MLFDKDQHVFRCQHTPLALQRLRLRTMNFPIYDHLVIF